MKKIITLVLLAAGTISFASAQSAKNSQYKNNTKDEKHGSNDYTHQQDFGKSNNTVFYSSSFSYKEKEAQIQKINREYNYKIAQVKSSRYLRSKEKSKQIKMLEKQRTNEIAQVQYRFDKSNHATASNQHSNHKW